MTITAVWDDDQKRGQTWADELGATYYDNLDTLLTSPDVEAVICDAQTTMHKEVILKAVHAGKHVFTEKALAPTVKECEEMADAIEKSGITFTISLPQRTSPVARLAKKLIDEDVFGKISLVRVRNGHNGVSDGWLPEYWFEKRDAAGGALMDLGCHPMYMATWLLGKPTKISALLTAPFGSKVDEAATASIEFENGAVFTGETSFISYKSPSIIEIYGSDATFISVDDFIRYSGKNIESLMEHDDITPKLPEDMPIPIEIFIEACVNGTGTPDMFGPREGVELTRLLENAYISNAESRIVQLNK